MSTISEGKSFYIMFDVLEGGILETIELKPENLQKNKSIILLDEENQTVWLWHGKARGLVSRRTALRQAQSLKGHGFQTGNAIVGRDLAHIREIDDRKVGRVPEDTQASEEFLGLLNNSYVDIGNKLYTKGSSGAAAKKPLEKPKVPEKKPEVADIPKPEEKPPTPEIAKPEETVKEKYNLKHVEVPEKKPPTTSKERKHELKPIKLPGETPDTKPAQPPSKPTPPSKEADVGIMQHKDQLKTAAVIIGVLDQYKDIWVSKKDNGLITIEQMDGKICSFKIINGELEYQPGSFNAIPDDKKKAIKAKIDELI